MSNFAQDEICGGGPDERLGVAIVFGDVVEDGLAQMGHRVEAAAADSLGGDLGEPALDLVEPGGVGRYKMQMEARIALEPAHNRGGLVRGVVVQHQMHLPAGRNACVYGLEEMQELLMSVAGMALADDLAGLDIEGRKQRNRSVPEVIVRGPLRPAGRQRQQRLGALQGLALALLVDAQHERVIRRIEVKADHVANLVDEERIGGKLERFLPMGFKAECSPDPMNSVVGQSEALAERAGAPLRRVLWLALQCDGNNSLHVSVGDRARGTAAHRVVQSGKSVSNESFPPFAYGLHRHSFLGRDGHVRKAIGASKHDARTKRQSLRTLAPRRQRGQPRSLVIVQNQLSFPSSKDVHAPLSQTKVTGR
jgi:hypothetical protein